MDYSYDRTAAIQWVGWNEDDSGFMQHFVGPLRSRGQVSKQLKDLSLEAADYETIIESSSLMPADQARDQLKAGSRAWFRKLNGPSEVALKRFLKTTAGGNG